MQSTRVKKYAGIGAIAVLFLIIGLYAYHTTRALVNGAIITVSSVSDGATITEKTLEVAGTAKNAVLLALDDRAIPVSQNGGFSEKLVLSPGYNIISLKAEDRFGKKVSKEIRLVYTPKIEPTDAQNIIIN